jgi:hypothetical protein
MPKKFLVALDLVQNELQNPRIQNLAAAPGAPTPVKGQMYFNTTDNTMYWYDGSQWIAAKAAAGATPAGTVTTQAIGDAPVVGVSTNFTREDHKHGMPGFGNVVAQSTFGAASANGSSAAIARTDHAHGTPVHDNNAHAAINLSALATPTTAVSFNNQRIISLADPTTSTDAVNKQYVDNLSAGLSWKDSVRAASTAQRALSGLTAIDGVTPVANDRILLKNQTAPAENGIWLAQAAAWTRATDADSDSDLINATVFVSEGGQADTAWVMTTNSPITLGTTGLTWVQFGAGTSYIAGNGLTLTGATFDIVAANTSIVVGADNIAVGFAGTGVANTAARSDHNHDGTYTKKFAANLAASTSQAVAHNLNTRDVTVEVFRNVTPWDTVECDVERTDVNNVTVKFAVAPAANDYRVVVTG